MIYVTIVDSQFMWNILLFLCTVWIIYCFISYVFLTIIIIFWENLMLISSPIMPA